MTDSISAIQAAPLNTLAMQLAQASNAAYIAEIVQAAVENSLLTSSAGQVKQPVDVLANRFPAEGLLNMDTPTLTLLNTIVGIDPTSANITGNLTAEQIQEIGILQQDMLGLEAAASAVDHSVLTTAATTVDLSLEAQAIASGATAASSVAVNASVSLTPVQLQQLSAIFAPIANQPLTPTLLLQIQNQLTAAGLSPQLLSLNAIFLAQNYMAGEKRANNSNNANEQTVAAVSPVDRVAVEDSAILT